ncbi:Leucine--tRNA ligase [Frankliniella fusca]|uniref:Leucine--tRNA ligase n=1 Tax=Frankliniella fusca TaxID=407009 RepID=A0AAE1GRA9_9NEOP|nr:Leucine--tRNA ligase [Frankliniella fusca]
MPQTLPSPQCMSFTDPEDLSDSEHTVLGYVLKIRLTVQLFSENFDQPLVETEHIAQPYNAARSSDVCSQMSTTQISCTAGLTKDSFALPAATGDLFFSSHEDLGTHLELHGDSDQISGQPSSSNETTMLLNDPVSIVEAFVSNEHLECDELPFFNEETQPKTSQEEEEAALFTTSGYVTESCFDALDAEPLPEGDLLTSDPPLYDGASVTVTEATAALLTFMLGCKITKDSQCDKCKNETKVGFYLHVPIIDQLRCLYARPGFVDLLSYRHQRVKKVPENIEDIYDGTFYRSFEGSLGPLDITLMWNTDGLSLYKSSNYQIWPIYFTINELPPELRHKEENLILGGIAIGYEQPRPNLLLKHLFEE